VRFTTKQAAPVRCYTVRQAPDGIFELRREGEKCDHLNFLSLEDAAAAAAGDDARLMYREREEALEAAAYLAMKYGCTAPGYLGIWQLYNPAGPESVTVYDETDDHYYPVRLVL